MGKCYTVNFRCRILKVIKQSRQIVNERRDHVLHQSVELTSNKSRYKCDSASREFDTTEISFYFLNKIILQMECTRR